MKRVVLGCLLVLGIVMVNVVSVAAQTVYTYPEENPIFAIAFPDEWDVSLEEDSNSVIALAPDGAIEIDIWPLDDVDDMDDASEEIGSLLDKYITDLNFNESETLTINGIEFFELSGSGTYREDRAPATFSVDFFLPDGETMFALLYWGNPDADTYYAEELAAIINSIQAQ